MIFKHLRFPQSLPMGWSWLMDRQIVVRDRDKLALLVVGPVLSARREGCRAPTASELLEAAYELFDFGMPFQLCDYRVKVMSPGPLAFASLGPRQLRGPKLLQ